MYELGNLLAIFCRGLNPTTCQFDLLSDEEFLDKAPNECWDYLEELAQKPQYCELTEIGIGQALSDTLDKFLATKPAYLIDFESLCPVIEEVPPVAISSNEPLVCNDPLENSLTIEEMNAEIDYLTSLLLMGDVLYGESLCPTSEVVSPIAILGNAPFDKSLTATHTTSAPIESPPPQEIQRVELVDFLGVDNYDCVYNPFLLKLVNTLKINLVRNMHLVELNFLTRLLLSLYSKYLILWHGRVQFLTEGLKWGDMLVRIALHSTKVVCIPHEGCGES